MSGTVVVGASLKLPKRRPDGATRAQRIENAKQHSLEYHLAKTNIEMRLQALVKAGKLPNYRFDTHAPLVGSNVTGVFEDVGEAQVLVVVEASKAATVKQALKGVAGLTGVMSHRLSPEEERMHRGQS